MFMSSQDSVPEELHAYSIAAGIRPLRIVALSSLALLAGSAIAPSPTSTIVFSSTRDELSVTSAFVTTGEIYLMNQDSSDVRRLTQARRRR